MIQKLFVCLSLELFLVNCNAQSISDDVIKEYIADDLEWLDYPKIAIQKDHREKVAHTGPNGPNKTIIDIDMSAVEVIDFDVKMQQFTIRMDLKINWSEKRLLFVNSTLANRWMNLPFSDVLWSPQLGIRSVMVLESWKLKLKHVGITSQSEVSKWYEHVLVQCSLAKMIFSLTTTVKCSMDFEMFPFDSHVCNLGVSSFCTEYISVDLVLL